MSDFQNLGFDCQRQKSWLVDNFLVFLGPGGLGTILKALTRWFGTHWDPFGPKTADWQTLLFSEINCHSRPSTHYKNSYDLTNFGSFSIFWPRLVANRAWCTTQEHLPDDLRLIGTHLGPKHGTDKLFFNHINCHYQPSTFYNEQLQFAQFRIFFQLIAQTGGPQGMVHNSRRLSRWFETHRDPFRPKRVDRQTFFLSEINCPSWPRWVSMGLKSSTKSSLVVYNTLWATSLGYKLEKDPKLGKS